MLANPKTNRGNELDSGTGVISRTPGSEKHVEDTANLKFVTQLVPFAFDQVQLNFASGTFPAASTLISSVVNLTTLSGKGEPGKSTKVTSPSVVWLAIEF